MDAQRDIDTEKLETAIAALMKSVREGSDFDTALLTESGLSPGAAERIARSANKAQGLADAE